MLLFLVIAAALVAYALSVRFVGHPLALSSWNAWNRRKPGRWIFFLFPVSTALGWLGYRSRYAHFCNPPIVEIANSCDISLAGGSWEREGRAHYLAWTAAVWPLKLFSCGVTCVIVLACNGLGRALTWAHQPAQRLVYGWTRAGSTE